MRVFLVASLAGCTSLTSGPSTVHPPPCAASASPGWTLSDCADTTFAPTDAQLHPWDGSVRVLDGDTLWRWDDQGWTSVASIPGAGTLTASDAGMFIADDLAQLHLHDDSLGLQNWTTLSASPEAMATISYDYMGPLGWSGQLLIAASGQLHTLDPWMAGPPTPTSVSLPAVQDMAVGDDVYLLLDGTAPEVHQLDGTGTTTPLSTGLSAPSAIAWNGWTRRLLVADAASDAVWCFDPQQPTEPGAVVLSGIDIDGATSLHTRYDGSAVLSTASGVVRFAQDWDATGCVPPTPVPMDCSSILPTSGWAISDCAGAAFEPRSAHLHPYDGSAYALGGDTLYQLVGGGWVARGSVPGATTLTTTDYGDVFLADATGGTHRYNEWTGIEAWNTSTVPARGMADAMNGDLWLTSNAGLWRMSAYMPGDLSWLHHIDGVDVAVGSDTFVLDASGFVTAVLGGQSIALPTTMTHPTGMAWDPLGLRLLITDADLDQVWSIDPYTGQAMLVLDNLDLPTDAWAGIDASWSGEFLVTTADGVVRFAEGDPQPCDTFVDADGDGLCDDDPMDSCVGLDNGQDADGDGLCDDLDQGDSQPCDDPIDLDLDGLCDADPADFCFGDERFGDMDQDHLCDDWGHTDLCRGDDAFGDVDGDLLCDERAVTDPCEGEGVDADGDQICDLPCFPFGVWTESKLQRCGCIGPDNQVFPGPDSDFDDICDSIDACHQPPGANICLPYDVCTDVDGDGTCEPDCLGGEDGICDAPPFEPVLDSVPLDRDDLVQNGRLAARTGTDEAETDSAAWTTLPDSRIAFLSAPDHDAASITFTAEVANDEAISIVHVRALVDGVVAEPGEVVLTAGEARGMRSAQFIAPVTEGVRHVEMQWRTLGGTATLSDATTAVITGASLATATSDVVTEAGIDWAPLEVVQVLGSDDHPAALRFASSMRTDGELELRVLIDGVEHHTARIGADSFPRSGIWTTYLYDLPHELLSEVTIEWRRVGGSFGTCSQRSLVVQPSPSTSSAHAAFSEAMVGGASTSDWSPLPGAFVATQIPPNGELLVRIHGVLDQAEAGTEFRLMMNDEPVGETLHSTDASGVSMLQLDFADVHLSGLGYGTRPVDLWVEWRSPAGLSTMAQHGMEVLTEAGVADVAPRSHNSLLGRLVPARGDRSLVIVPVVTQEHAGDPALVAAATPVVDDLMHDAQGVQAFFDDMSGGRFAVQANVLPVWVTAGPFQSYDTTLMTAFEDAIDREGGDVYLETLDLDGDGSLDEVDFAVVWVTPTAQQLDPTTVGVAAPYSNDVGDSAIGAYELPGLLAISTSSDAWTVSGVQVLAHELAHSLLGIHDAHTKLLAERSSSTDWPAFEQGVEEGPFAGHLRGNVYTFDEPRQIRSISVQGDSLPGAVIQLGLWREDANQWTHVQSLDLTDDGALLHRGFFASPPTVQPGERYLIGWFNTADASHWRDSRALPDSGDPSVTLVGQIEQPLAVLGDVVADVQPGAFLVRLEHEVIGRPALPIAHPLAQGGSTLMTGPQSLLWLDAPHRVKLGWAEPIVVRESGIYTLPDVNHDDRVLMLPRVGCDGTEAFFLENRSTGTANDHPLFDASHSEDGVAVWHFIESGTTTMWTDAPVCSEVFWPEMRLYLGAKQSRLLRPLDHPKLGPVSRFSALTREDHLDDDPRVCWDDASLDPGRQSLRWADDAPSGYRIDFLDGPGDTMQVDITIDPLAPWDCGAP